MAGQDWQEIPDAVRRAVEKETGSVSSAVSPSDGRNSDLLATLQAERGRFFVKGVVAGTRRARMQQVEAAVNPVLPRTVAPRLLWEVEADGWSVLGFEHVNGRHAELRPGSRDLPLVVESVATMVSSLARCRLDLQTASEQWEWMSPWRRLSKSTPDELDPWDQKHIEQLIECERHAIQSVRGDSLVHGDLHPLNILVSERARVVDWAWSTIGAAWLDAAALVLRLVAAGHTPAQAEEWANQISAYRDAPDRAVTAFAVLIMGAWVYKGAFPQLNEAARQYVQYRLGG
ncbi:phosphotransferase [Amycolatopsis sp. NPDC051373]|uniref:phosphotransferase n=1 Tax=Amycolatopsis sp. NPDC051373 TaxID=3155801 RepID=UPI00344CDDD0